MPPEIRGAYLPGQFRCRHQTASVLFQIMLLLAAANEVMQVFPASFKTGMNQKQP
jgi:hypothetical protein